MFRCSDFVSASSARPDRAAELWRFMLRDDGGVGTVSSSVRRARSSRGDFRLVLAWRFPAFLDVRPAALRAPALALDRLGRVRDALRFLALAPTLARRERFVLAIISSFRTLTVSR